MLSCDTNRWPRKCMFSLLCSTVVLRLSCAVLVIVTPYALRVQSVSACFYDFLREPEKTESDR